MQTSARHPVVKRDQRFDVVCSCGRSFSGVRTAQFQVLECEICGNRVFVLPECRYPEVELPQVETGRFRGGGQRSEVGGQRSEGRGQRSEVVSGQSTSGSEVGDRKTDPQSAIRHPQSEPAGIVLKERRRLLTPARWGGVFVLICASLTAYWVYQRNQVRDAEQTFRDRADDGFAALKKEDFVAAYEEFRQAVAALDKLDRDDNRARLVRQMAKECEAATDLCDAPLHVILAEAEQAAAQDSGKWSKQFRDRYAGHWLILDTTLHRSSATGRVSIDYPLAVAGRPVTVDGNLDAFDQLDLGEQPRRVIFAAQLTSCGPAGGDPARWELRFDRQTAFLWSNYDNLRALGLAVAAESDASAPGEIDSAGELQRLLQQQSQAIGLEVSP